MLFLLLLIFYSLLVDAFLRHHLLDIPNPRSSHVTPPLVEEVFFRDCCILCQSFFFACSFLQADVRRWPYLPLLVFPLALVGLLDDRLNLPAIWRVCSVLHGSHNHFHKPTITFFFCFLIFVLCLIFVVVPINFINFMDGVDGLVAGSMSVVLITAAIHLLSPCLYVNRLIAAFCVELVAGQGLYGRCGSISRPVLLVLSFDLHLA